jgi:hypothetical protein
MKRILLVLAVIGLFVGISYAVDFNTYTVSVSTITPTGGDITTANIRIGKLIISNSDDTTLQTVTVYEHRTTTYTPTAIMVIDFGAGDATNPVVLEWQQSDMFRVPGYAVRKSTTASTVNVTVQYR